MSSVEIEDVLSSIRRLVSEDLRPAARPVPQAAVPPASQSATQMAASKLILTPALRVVAEDAPVAAIEAMPDPASQPDTESWDDGEVAAFVNVEDDAVFEDDADWQPKADVISLTAMQDPLRTKAGAGTAAESAPEILPEITPSALSERSQQAVDAPVDVTTAEPLEWEAQPNAALAEWEDALSEDAPIPEDAPVPEDAVSESLDAVWADAAEAEVLRQLADEGVTPQAAALSDDDRIYEENLLRDLVRDIIREELQGELGERITRNVRKLVRAEIARAMALRDFD